MFALKYKLIKSTRNKRLQTRSHIMVLETGFIGGKLWRELGNVLCVKSRWVKYPEDVAGDIPDCPDCLKIHTRYKLSKKVK